MSIRPGTYEAHCINKIFLNWREEKHVLLLDEKKGKLILARNPFKLDKYKKRFLTRTAYGSIRIERKQ